VSASVCTDIGSAKGKPSNFQIVYCLFKLWKTLLTTEWTADHLTVPDWTLDSNPVKLNFTKTCRTHCINDDETGYV